MNKMNNYYYGKIIVIIIIIIITIMKLSLALKSCGYTASYLHHSSLPSSELQNPSENMRCSQQGRYPVYLGTPNTSQNFSTLF